VQPQYQCHGAIAIFMPQCSRNINATVQPQYQCLGAIAVSMP